MIADEVAENTWQRSCLSASALMASRFPIGAALANLYGEFLINVAIQTTMGQALAVEVAIGTFDGDGQKIPDLEFDGLCSACGMWM